MKIVDVSIHTIFEPPTVATNDEVVVVSVWLCFGPFEEEAWHAAEHKNSICLASCVQIQVGDQLTKGLCEMFEKIGIKPTLQKYPGD